MKAVSTDEPHHRHQQPTIEEDEAYQRLLRNVNERPVMLKIMEQPFFRTSTRGLWDTFLEGIQRDRRSHYSCRECRNFFDRYGGLVTIDDQGRTDSLFFNCGSFAGGGSVRFFADALFELERTVEHALVTGIFYAKDRVWGNEKSQSRKAPGGVFHHFHARPHISHVWGEDSLKTPGQAMAEKREEHGMLAKSLAEFSIEQARRVEQLLIAGQFWRAEKHLPVARWFVQVHESVAGKSGPRRDNLIWRATANAPTGFCHVRSTIIGTLLDDVKAGKSFENIKRAYAEKTHPLQYQRPQAAPAVGQIEAAEALIARMGMAPSFMRRYATLADVRPHAIWLSREAIMHHPPATTGLFSHLKPKSSQGPMDFGTEIITWEKFRRDVLPSADVLEYRTVSDVLAPYFAFVTAEHPSAPHLWQWETDARRQPVNWYLYLNGSLPSVWNIGMPWPSTPETFVRVDAITMQPNRWLGGNEHQGEGAYFVLAGARDLRAPHAPPGQGPGLALFPEELRGELRPIRSTLEAFSANGRISGAEGASACGICLQKRPGLYPVDFTFRVTSQRGGVRKLFRLDRFE